MPLGVLRGVPTEIMTTESSSFPSDFDSPEEFLSAIIDSSDDAIITKDLNGVVTSWNKGAERVFGYTAEEMVGRPIMTLIPKDRQDEEPKILQRLRRGERVDHFDTRRVCKDGREIEIALTISPVKNSRGEIVGASKIARDVTMQKQAARSIARANAEVERQSRMKDEFLTTLSHELRTPLQSIVGWVQILKGGDVDEGELAKGLEVIGRNAEAQQHIIEDLLDMNRILSGKVRLDVQKVDLGVVVQSALDSVMPAAQGKSISVRAVLDSRSKPVAGDPQRLQQVFWNLLNNAIKFTPKGGRIEVLLRGVDSQLVVSFADSGIGISPEFLPHVFDRFRQADSSTTRVHSGLGLGLAIVKHIVELHGGVVKARSEGENRGATFEVCLPVAAVRDESIGLSKAAVDGREEPPVQKLQGINVVVVDDDDDSRDLIARTLIKSGASVRTAGSAHEGLCLIDETVPDVLVSDIGMPEMNGFSFIESVRSRPTEKGGKVPAAALTAYTRVEDRVQALCAGFQILLPKPVDAGELIATVRSLSHQAR
jgi:PAS domain S-box-containing protein